MPTWTKPVGATANVYAPQGQEAAVAWNRVSLATTDLTLNNSIEMVRLPQGAVVQQVLLRTGDLDGGAAGLLSVGVAGDTERYIRRVSCQAAATFTAGADATTVGTMLAAVPFTGETAISILVQTAPATPAAGTVDLSVLYVVE